MKAPTVPLSRRRFLQMASLAGLGTVLAPSELLAQYRFLDTVRVDNPPAQYSTR